jgi:WD40 repeat protein/nucleoside phosphorylase/uncharacterized protein YjbI with pentapeptide repeats
MTIRKTITTTRPPLDPASVASALDILAQKKILTGLDLERLRSLVPHLPSSESRMEVSTAIPLMFGHDKEEKKVEDSLRQMVKRITDLQNEAIANGRLLEGERLSLVVERKSGNAPRRLWLSGQSNLTVQARTPDLDNDTTSRTLYDNPGLPPELLGQGTEKQRPILLLTVNDRETDALRRVFSSGQPKRQFAIEDYPYEQIDQVEQRPVVAFRCRMGSGRTGAALLRVVKAISHLRPSLIIAVGIAYGRDNGKQKLGDVLVAEKMQDYEPECLNDDGSHTSRGDSIPASGPWLERAIQIPPKGFKLRKGLLLSGEKLVDNKEFRDQLNRLFPENIGGEMEGTGLVTACQAHKTDWLIVKGVSDWGDGSKNKLPEEEANALQYQAALNAARVVYSAIHLKAPPAVDSSEIVLPAPAQEVPCCRLPEAKIRDFDQCPHAYDNHGLPMGMAESLRKEASGPKATSRQSAHETLRTWLQRPDAPPVFALLGEYGMGKTINCQRLYSDLRELRNQTAPPDWAREPLYFDLRQLSLFKNLERNSVVPLPETQALVDDLIGHGWLIQPGQPRPDLAQLRTHIERGALIIVDGMDECLVHLVEAQHPQFTSAWLNLIADIVPAPGLPAPRLLLSCRTNFFKTMADQRNLFTGQHRGQVDAAWYEALVLLPLEDEQVNAYLASALPDLDLATVKETIAHTHNLGELAQRPMTLKLIAEHITELEAMRLRGEPVNSAALYRLVARKWLERDEGKHHLQAEHKLRLMPALAAHLWRSALRSLPYEELHLWFHQWRATQPDLAERYHTTAYNQTKLEEDLRTATFVVRQDEDAEQAEGFRFAHSSLLEYFLARYLAEAVEHDRPGDWAMALPSDETLHFLAEILTLEQARLSKQGQDHDLGRNLNRWRADYRPQASELLLAYALRDENQAPRPLTAGFNLTGARLRGWKFGQPHHEGEHALLPMQGNDFRGADLRETRFDQVRLDGGDFRGARLDRSALQYCGLRQTRFAESSLTGTVFRHCRCAEATWPADDQLCYRAQWVACDGREAALPDAQHLSFPAAGPSPAPTARLAWLTGHDRAARSVAFAPDGKRIVSGAWDNTVRIWDAASGECLSILKGHEGPVNSVAFSPDGKRIVSGAEDTTIRAWNAGSGDCLAILKGHEGEVNSVTFAPDGKHIVSGAHDNTIRVWDTASGECLAILKGHERQVNSVAFAPDGKRIVSGAHDNTIRIWDAGSGECLSMLKGHERGVNSVAFSPDSQRIISGAKDDTIRVWDADTGECLTVLKGPIGGVNSVAFDPDGKRIVSGEGNKTIRVWDAGSGECLAILKGHKDMVNSVAFSPSGKRIVSGAWDNTIRIWDAGSGECLAILKGHEDRFWSVAFSPDGKRIISGGDDNTIGIWDASSGECLANLRGHKAPVRSVAFSPDGKHIVSGAADKTIRIWDADSGECVAILKGHEDMVLSVAFSSDGKRIVSGALDDTIRIWDAGSGKCAAVLKGHEAPVISVTFAPDGKRIASGAWNNTIRLWDAISGKCLTILKGHEDFVNSVAFAPDGKRIASGAWDNTIRLWDPGTGECVAILKGHEGHVRSVVFNNDGKHIVSGADDNTIRIWDAGSGECVAILKGHVGHVRSVALNNDGKHIVSGARDNTIRIWDAGTGECLRCHWATETGEISGLAVWRPPRPHDPADTGELLSVSGDAWRLLAWQAWDFPGAPGKWTRLPLVY